MTNQLKYSGWKTASLSLLRMAIGWHCLHEGLVKLMKVPAWTGKGYMAYSTGPFAGIFQAMAESDAFIAFSDFMVVWTLILGGGLLLLGLLTRPAALVLMGLIFTFYLAMPPVSTLARFGLPVAGAEGNYWIVNKNLIEILALWVVVTFENGDMLGLDAWFRPWLKGLTAKA